MKKVLTEPQVPVVRVLKPPPPSLELLTVVGRVADRVALAVAERAVAGRLVAGAGAEAVVDLQALAQRGDAA